MIGALLRSRYELNGLLSDGPVFAAYSARDRVIGRDVTVRIVKPPFSTEPAFSQALSSAVAKYAAVHQSGIEAITELDRDELNPFLVGELTRGVPLAERIRKLAPFSIPVSVATGISICQALDAVHRLGLAHGDLQSSNISVLSDGDVRLQLTGIWEAYSASPTAGAIVVPGMAPYLSPEVSAGGIPTPQSDVYAVGVLLFELLSGRRPYHGESPVAVALQHANTATPSVRGINASTPVVLDEIVKKAMAKRPSDRYANAGELLSDLRILQDALRFGRALSWPLRREASQEPRAITMPQPVAPKMGAIRDEADERHDRRERDVPMWMIVVVTLLTGVFLSIILGWLFFNLSKPKLVQVPTLTGLSVSEARQQLEASGLHFLIKTKEPSDQIESDHVIDSDPAAQSRVYFGGTVRVTVSEGSRMVAVPDLVGSTLDNAKIILGNLNLDLDPAVGHLSVPADPPDQIVKQSPSPNTKVDRATKVKVFINTPNAPPDTDASPTPPAASDSPSSSNPSNSPSNGAPPATTDPATSLDSNASSKRYLYSLDIHVGVLPAGTRVRVTMRDDLGTHDVFGPQEVTDPDVKVSAQGTGKQAVFTIFYNDVQMKTVKKDAETAALP